MAELTIKLLERRQTVASARYVYIYNGRSIYNSAYFPKGFMGMERCIFPLVENVKENGKMVYFKEAIVM